MRPGPPLLLEKHCSSRTPQPYGCTHSKSILTPVESRRDAEKERPGKSGLGGRSRRPAPRQLLKLQQQTRTQGFSLIVKAGAEQREQTTDGEKTGRKVPPRPQ